MILEKENICKWVQTGSDTTKVMPINYFSTSCGTLLRLVEGTYSHCPQCAKEVKIIDVEYEVEEKDFVINEIKRHLNVINKTLNKADIDPLDKEDIISYIIYRLKIQNKDIIK